MSDFVDALLTFKITDLFVLIGQVIDNPLGNVQASLLLLIGVVVMTLLAIVVAILLLGFRGDEDDEWDEEEFGEAVAAGEEAPQAPAAAAAAEMSETGADIEAEPAQPARLTPAERRWRGVKSAAVGMAILLAAWLLTGLTTGTDLMCLSCHRDTMPHATRMADDPSSDPHRDTDCIRCHENGGIVGGLTYDVPARAIHFAQGIVTPKATTGYGVPIASRACRRCHPGLEDGTIEIEDRGLLISHKEPLDAGATCMDCHEMQTTTGVVAGFTVGMAPCLRCHDNEQASAACEGCHTKDIAYAVHVNFDPVPQRQVPDKRCYTCHDPAPCDACHGIRMPHTAEFIGIDHPLIATRDIWYNDANTCEACHTATRNPCTSCHKNRYPGHPVTHWPNAHGLAGPKAGVNGCNGCHGYLAGVSGRNFCGVCHEEYVGWRP
jgi:hypothetical protein